MQMRNTEYRASLAIFFIETPNDVGLHYYYKNVHAEYKAKYKHYSEISLEFPL